jgi:diguanylate cyclase (GGDEF)-like protein
MFLKSAKNARGNSEGNKSISLPISDSQKKLEQLIEIVIATAQSRGWSTGVRQLDKTTHRYALVDVSGGPDPCVITRGAFEICCGDDIDVSLLDTSCGTSTLSFGMNNSGLYGLNTAIQKEIQKLPWIPKPQPNGRTKSAKFGILDTPSQLGIDLRKPAGPRGRALLYVDIDGFKSINAKHTETIVDQTVLPSFQQLLSSIVEAHGYIYAEGGDEVIILLNNTSVLVACALAEDIRRTVASTVFKIGDDSVEFTVSIGVAHSDQHPKEGDLQLKANEAKRESKSAGKNRVAIASVDKGFTESNLRGFDVDKPKQAEAIQ